jgi:16S rRNA (cytidine1402-2'-O)-methyltransferase
VPTPASPGRGHPGSSALLAALVVSGLPTDRVAFDGFLPRRGAGRRERLAELAREPRTVVLYVSPHRAATDLGDLAAALGGQRRAALCRELTKLHEEVRRGTLDELAASAGSGVRGEVTLVIAGADGEPTAAATAPSLDAQVAEVARELAAGGGTKAPSRRSPSGTVWSKRRLFEAVLDARAADRDRTGSAGSRVGGDGERSARAGVADATCGRHRASAGVRAARVARRPSWSGS